MLLAEVAFHRAATERPRPVNHQRPFSPVDLWMRMDGSSERSGPTELSILESKKSVLVSSHYECRSAIIVACLPLLRHAATLAPCLAPFISASVTRLVPISFQGWRVTVELGVPSQKMIFDPRVHPCSCRFRRHVDEMMKLTYASAATV